MTEDAALYGAPTALVAPAVPVTNGAAEPAPARPTGPRIRRLEEWQELPEPYEGFKLRFWVNYPQRLVLNLDSEEAIRAAVREIMLEHNGWQDDEGELPQPHDPAFIERCPTHLFTAAFGLVRQAATTLPNSLQPTRRR